jgi:hypothetical protein
MSFVAPWLTPWTGSCFCGKGKVLTEVVSVFGVVLGSAAHALVTHFRWEVFVIQDTANHLVGATLMGVGGVAAMGCTIGQGCLASLP